LSHSRHADQLPQPVATRRGRRHTTES